jgi:hypothetical protein
VQRELKMKSRTDKTFPSTAVYNRLGLKQQIAAQILEYCRNRTGYEDVIAWCTPIVGQPQPHQSDDFSDAITPSSDASTKEGHVYMALLKLGREKRYKIGKSIPSSAEQIRFRYNYPRI